MDPLGDLGVLLLLQELLLMLLLLMLGGPKNVCVVEAGKTVDNGCCRTQDGRVSSRAISDKGGIWLVGCRERTEQVGEGHVGRGSRRDK